MNPKSEVTSPLEVESFTVKSQHQMYYESERKSAALNSALMETIQHKENPLTREDLEALIRRRPEIYGRFSGFLAVLPPRKD